MKTELAYYEIYPKVLPTGRPVSITIRPLGAHAVFSEKFCYQIMIVPLNETNLNSPERPYPRHELIPSKGNLCFDHCFETEGQHTLVITVKQQNRRVLALPVYAAADDLYRLRPYRGDMHCHSYYSDGMEAPAIVAANYRKAGFDFLAITDHGLYEPSREAIDAFREVPIDLRLFPGEEVHPPGNNTHYIHFGGDYSINELMYKNQERYQDELRQLADQLAPPPGINIQEYASCLWVCREIGKAGGLAVMVHPCWIQEYAYHIG
ncbi:MAG: hypothetical protein LBQ38_10400 [Spirochaetaceae bacterium]|jgi:hypothetical protein|nr:hypothetical protein [Spirochaetaceae bacterium]